MSVLNVGNGNGLEGNVIVGLSLQVAYLLRYRHYLIRLERVRNKVRKT